MLSLWQGVRAGVPIAVGYVPIAVAFGLLAGRSGLSLGESAWMSAVVYAGASQFIGVQLWTTGAGPVTLILTTFLVNLRHLLMSASLSTRLAAPRNRRERRWLPLVAFGVTDETFAVASLGPRGNLSLPYLLGLNLTAYSAWVGGTLLGGVAGLLLPATLAASMNIALYAMFIGLLIPSVRGSLRVAFIAATAAGVNSLLLALDWPRGWALVVAAVAAAALGTLPLDLQKGLPSEVESS